MQYRRSTLIMLVISGLTLVLSACAARATGGSTISAAGDDKAAVDMPALVIDYDTQGNPSIGGLPLTLLASSAGIDSAAVEQLTLSEDQITQLTRANIQHAQIDNSVDGLIILVNGEPIPSIVWDEESLSRLAEFINRTPFAMDPLVEFLPIIRTVGVGVILRFPVAADAALIPMVVAGDASKASQVQQLQDAFINEVDNPAQVQIIVDYAEDGHWTVAGMDATQWTQVIAAVPWEDLNLSSTIIEGAARADLQTLALATNVDGIFVSINGNTLPYLTWNQGELQHLLQLANRLDLLQRAGINSADSLLTFLEEWLPILQLANTRITVNFPR